MNIKRPNVTQFGEQELRIPAYFPSISSVKTALQPIDYLQVLTSLASLNNLFLISAYDLITQQNQEVLASALNNAKEGGAIILMDSGNYESYWKEERSSWRQEHFHTALENFPSSAAFCFDEQDPPRDHDEHVKMAFERWKQDQEKSPERMVIPIIHGHYSDLPLLCLRIAELTGVTMVAVPERRLGNGVIERSIAVQAIRRELNKAGRYVALHLLGTGNPISIALYSSMGADCFDGLEWCQTVVDHDTALLYHLSQSDFFERQTDWANAGLSFHARTLAHNIEFYSSWMCRLRSALQQEKFSEFCEYNFPERIFLHCSRMYNWG